MTRFDMLQNTNSVWLCEIYSKLTRRNEWLVVDQKNNVKSPAKKMNIFIRSSEERRRRPDIDERAMMWRASLTGLLYLSAFNPRKRPNPKKKKTMAISLAVIHTHSRKRDTRRQTEVNDIKEPRRTALARAATAMEMCGRCWVRQLMRTSFVVLHNIITKFFSVTKSNRPITWISSNYVLSSR